VVVDIGTGDGRYVYRSARSDPDRFYIGIDVERGALQKISEKIHRNSKKGSLSNVLFVLAPVKDLPSVFVQLADEIHIHFSMMMAGKEIPPTGRGVVGKAPTSCTLRTARSSSSTPTPTSRA
jgi:hypothetical protein